MPDSLNPHLIKLGHLTDVLENHEIKRQKIMEFMKSAPCICFIKDGETGRYQFINKAFGDVLGIPEESIIGKTDVEIFPVDVAQRYVTNDLKVLKTKHKLVIISKIKDHMYMLAKFLITNGGESIGGFGLELPDSFTLRDCLEEVTNAS